MGELTDAELIEGIENDNNTPDIPNTTEQSDETEGSEPAGENVASGGTGSDDNGDGNGDGDGDGESTGTSSSSVSEEEVAEDTFSVTVNGEEIQVSRDELIRGYATNQSSHERFQEAALSKKQAESFIEQLKTDPWKVLSNPSLGLNPRELAEQYLTQQIEYEQLSEEQQELMQARNQLHQYELERKGIQDQEHQQNVDNLTQQYHDEYSTRINTALSGNGLPNTENTVRRMASYMSEALNSTDPGIQQLSDSDIAELVREDFEEDFKQMFSQADAETLERFIGADAAKTIRKNDIAKLKGNGRTNNPVKAPTAKEKAEQVWETQDEFDSYLDNL